MKKVYTLIICAFLVTLNAFAQAPRIQWQNSYGGTNYEDVVGGKKVPAGGYVFVGNSLSNNGNYDGWVIKLDDNGTVEWQKFLGIAGASDILTSIDLTLDGGYVVAGYTFDTTIVKNGNSNYWISKLDASGNLQWEKTYGTKAFDIAKSVVATSDGSYFVAGYSNANTNDTIWTNLGKFNMPINRGGNDYWILKLDLAGNPLGQTTVGGSNQEEPRSIIETSDGNLLIAGFSKSSGGNLPGNKGGSDFWLLKMDKNLGGIWTKNYGGTKEDIATKAIENGSGEYVVCGSSGSSDGDLSVNKGGTDFWVIQVDASTGNITTMNQSFGGAGNEEPRAIQEVAVGGYVLSGYSMSNISGDVSGHFGSATASDYWVLKIDNAGNKEWERNLGGTLDDKANAVIDLGVEGYLIAGTAKSKDKQVQYFATGQPYVNNPLPGKEDMWLVKLGGTCNQPYTNYSQSDTVICEGSSINFTNNSFGDDTLYEWRNNGVVFSTTKNPSLTFPNEGKYVVTLKVYKDGACFGTFENDTIRVGKIPAIPTITSSAGNSYCKGDSISLYSSVEASYQWYKNGVLITGETKQSLVIKDTLAAKYKVMVTNIGGCTNISRDTLISVNSIPPVINIAYLSDTTFCDGGSVTLEAPVGYTYEWSNHELTRSIIVLTSGSYIVTLTNSSNCVAVSKPITVTVNSPTVPSIAASGALALCAGDSILIFVTDTTDLRAFHWSTGIDKDTIKVKQEGDFSITVTNKYGCTAESNTITTTVNALPTPTLTTDKSSAYFCIGDTVILTSSSAVSYQWFRNNVSLPGETNQTLDADSSGSYYVRVTDSDGCKGFSRDTIIKSVSLPDTALSVFGKNPFCIGDSIVLSTPPNQGTYLWSNGQTTSSVVIKQAGTFFAIITNLGGCKDTTDSVTINVNPLPATPVITASGAVTFCQGDSVTLNAPAGFAKYQWSSNDTLQNTTIHKTSNNSVTVTDNNGCVSAGSNVIPVKVNPLPVDSIKISGGKPQLCPGTSVTLTASGGNSKYEWSNGDSLQSTVINTAGTYYAVLTTVNGCTDTSKKIIVIMNPKPAAKIYAQGATTFCQGKNVTLMDTAAVTNMIYLWTPGGSTKNAFSPTTSGNYSFIKTNPYGCKDTSDVISVKVNPLPVVSITANGPTTFCKGDSVKLTATGGIKKYLWFPTFDTTRTLTINPVDSIFKSDSLIAYVAVTDSNGCQATSNSLKINSKALPSVSITSNTSTQFCDGGSVTLIAKNDLSAGGFNSYAWSNGGNTSSITTNLAGTYTVTVTNSLLCSRASNPVAVNIFPLPPVPVIIKDSTLLTSSDSINQHQWYKDDILIIGATGRIFNATSSGKYKVRVTSSYGCVTFSNEVTVTINPQGSNAINDLTKGNDLAIYPNPFTDHTIISYEINKQSSVSLEIFNQLGEKVAELINGKQDAGKYSYDLFSSSLKTKSGIYFVRFKKDNIVKTQRLVNIY